MYLQINQENLYNLINSWCFIILQYNINNTLSIWCSHIKENSIFINDIKFGTCPNMEINILQIWKLHIVKYGMSIKNTINAGIKILKIRRTVDVRQKNL